MTRAVRVLRLAVELCVALAALFCIGHGDAAFGYPLVLGIDRQTTQSMHAPLIALTVEVLQKKLGPDGLVVRVLPLSELRNAVQNNKVDFFLASSAFYRQMVLAGAKDLATAQTVRAADPNFSQGALVLVRGERLEIRTFGDLSARSLGYLTGEDPSVLDMTDAELVAAGAAAASVGFDTLEALLRALKNDAVDAVVLPSCFLEWHAEEHDVDTAWLRVISPRQNAALLCAYSTKLYPNLTMAALPRMPSFMAKSITQALLDLESASENDYFWGIATNFHSVDRMLRALNKDAWAQERQWSLKRFVRRNYPLVAALLLALAGLAAHSLVVGFLVRKRTSELSASLEEQKRLRSEAQKSGARLEKMQKIGILGQISALFAHELGQPLNSISMYAFSLRRQISRGLRDPDKVSGTLREIEEQSARAGSLIRKIRETVRSHAGKNGRINLTPVVQMAVENFKRSSPFNGTIEVQMAEDLFVMADPLEIELMIVNLLRNAAQAQAGQKKAAIFVRLTQRAEYADFRISDRGPEISDKIIARLTAEHGSSKPEGLGLGLSIVGNLVDMMGGRMDFARSAFGGLQVHLLIPLINPKSRSEAV